MPDRLSDVFNVKDWGAIGDNINNDGPPIQAAISACQSQGGGRVFFPPGIYNVTGGAITCGSTNSAIRVDLVGASFGATLLQATISKGSSNTFDNIGRVEGMKHNGVTLELQ
jgi:hypothetical protein